MKKILFSSVTMSDQFISLTDVLKLKKILNKLNYSTQIILAGMGEEEIEARNIPYNSRENYLLFFESDNQFRSAALLAKFFQYNPVKVAVAQLLSELHGLPFGEWVRTLPGVQQKMDSAVEEFFNDLQ